MASLTSEADASAASAVGMRGTQESRRKGSRPGGVDRVLRFGLRGAGVAVLAIMAAVGLFLALRGANALRVSGWSFFTTAAWEPDSHNFGIAAVITGTLLIAGVAIATAVPLATAGALYISEYAPRRARQTLIYLVDLMAAVPSIVYGLWGVTFLQPHVTGLSHWLHTYLGWIPAFAVDGVDPRDPLTGPTPYTSSTFIAGIVVGLMVTPIACSIMRETFSQAPPGEREAAYALGATRWGVIRSVVLPYARGGMIGGTMLGLGRALGETIAVYVIISPVFAIQPHLLQSGTSSVSSLIALRYGAATPFGISALFAAGLALFAMTLVVNFAASTIIARSRSGAMSEA
jgi:phosphate transport system permease protein